MKEIAAADAHQPAPGGADTVAFLRRTTARGIPRVIEAADALSAREEPDSFYEIVIELVLSGIESVAAQTAPATCWR